MNEQMKMQAQVNKALLDAQELHSKIMANGLLVATAMVEFSRELKEMRDKKLYQTLGYAEFGEYVEQAVGLKQRQAYNYISNYERLGPKFLEDHAHLGVTKLGLLAEISGPDRAEFAAENDLGGMSVTEVKALVQKASDQGKQLSMLEAELADAAGSEKTYKAEAERLAAELEEARAAAGSGGPAREEELAAARAEAAEQARREAETQAAKALKEERAKLRRELEAKQAKEAAGALAKAREEGEKKARETLEAETAREKARLEAEKKGAEQRAQELAKKLELAASQESTAFAVWFDQLQAAFGKMLEQAAALETRGKAEEAARLRAALKKALAAMGARV